MRFMFVLNMPEGTWISKEIVTRIVEWKRRMAAEGVHLTGNPLKPPGMTTTIYRRTDGSFCISEAPLEDATRIFYAFEIIDCANMDEDVRIARGHPALEFDHCFLEVREIWDSMGEDVMGEEYYLKAEEEKLDC